MYATLVECCGMELGPRIQGSYRGFSCVCCHCAPAADYPDPSRLEAIFRGGLEKMNEAGCSVIGARLDAVGGFDFLGYTFG